MESGESPVGSYDQKSTLDKLNDIQTRLDDVLRDAQNEIAQAQWELGRMRGQIMDLTAAVEYWKNLATAKEDVNASSNREGGPRQ